jgi:hypothetical protein
MPFHLQDRRTNQSGNQREALLATSFTLVSCMDYSSILTMQATFFSETSIDSGIRGVMPQNTEPFMPSQCLERMASDV